MPRTDTGKIATLFSGGTEAREGRREIGGYRLREFVGRGECGSVYRVEGDHAFLEGQPCVVRIAGVPVGNPESLEELLSRARDAITLKHPAIAKLYDVGRDGERIFWVVEHLRGIPLDAFLRRSRSVSPAIASYLIVELLDALDYAHNIRTSKRGKRGIVHGRISATSIYVSWDGRVKLTNFGLPRRPRWELRGSREALRDVAAERSDVSSDLWAIAVLWCELLGVNVDRPHQEIAQALSEGQLCGGESDTPLPKGIMATLERAFALHPDDRFTSAAHLRRAVQLARRPASVEDLASHMEQLVAPHDKTPGRWDVLPLPEMPPIVLPQTGTFALHHWVLALGTFAVILALLLRGT